MAGTDLHRTTMVPPTLSKEDYYKQGNADAAVATSLQIQRLEKRRELTSRWTNANDRLVIVLVGLPGRGKSFLCRKLQAFYNWRGEECRVFNVGKYRRFAASGDGEKEQDANFFDSSNVEATRLREEVAMRAMDDLLHWIERGEEPVDLAKIAERSENGGGGVHKGSSLSGSGFGLNRTAIFDATNTTKARRKAILDKVAAFQDPARPIGTIFVESICDDEELLTENFRYKISTSPDYNSKPEEEALQDLLNREQKYKERYETLDDDSQSYIKVFNFSSKVMSNQIYGDLSKLLVPSLMAWHIGDRPIFFARAGKAFGHDDEPMNSMSSQSDQSKHSNSSKGSRNSACRRSVVVQSQGLGTKGSRFRDALGKFLQREGEKFSRKQLRRDGSNRRIGGGGRPGVGTSLNSSALSILSSIAEDIGKEEKVDSPLPFPTRAGRNSSAASMSSNLPSPFPCFIMTSTMPRAIETVTWQGPWQDTSPLTIRELPSLNPLDRGDFSGMDTDEVKEEDPQWFQQMEKDPFSTRYPGGESYEDLVSRLETTVIDIEQQVTPVLVVSHLHIIQVLLAYFLNTPVEECASIKVPHNTVIQISPTRGGGWRETRHELIDDDDDDDQGGSSEDEDCSSASFMRKAMWALSVRPTD